MSLPAKPFSFTRLPTELHIMILEATLDAALELVIANIPFRLPSRMSGYKRARDAIIEALPEFEHLVRQHLRRRGVKTIRDLLELHRKTKGHICWHQLLVV